MEHTAKRMGRPPSEKPFTDLLHVRITGEMSEWLDQIADSRLDKPTVTQLVREAIAMLIEEEQRKARRREDKRK